MRILSLPPPHHWETTDGQPVEGWADHDGQVVPVVYDEVTASLIVMDAHIRPKTPARGPTNPDGPYMPDDPRKERP